MKPFRLIPANTSINFLGKKWIAFVLSIGLILATAAILLLQGLNFGIDFTGGIVIEIRTSEPVDLATIRTVLANASLGEVALQKFGTENDIMIRLGQQSGDTNARMQAVAEVKTLLSNNLPTEIDYRKVDFVGPQVGRELIQAGALSLGLAFAAIMLYIWFRFEWQFGIGAIAALLHDVVLTLGLFSFLKLEFNLTSIAAILTIIGYSINDSVVIYDRIRENLRKYKKKPLEEVLNQSINDTLSRTILTAGTTIAALGALVILGGHVIYGFSLAVLFGVIIGTYSSIYIAAPLLIFMQLRREGEQP